MGNIILIFICLLAGVLLRKINTFPKDAHKVLNFIVINISLPSLALLYIPQIEVTSQIIYPAASMYIVFGFALAFFILLSKIFKWDKQTTGALIMTAGLCNSSFVGFPVLVTMFGDESLKTGVIIDQAGSFVILATFGVIVSSYYSSRGFSTKKIIKDILLYPSFIATIIAVGLKVFGYTHDKTTMYVLERLGGLIVILALISVGLQLKVSFKHLPYKELFIGLMFKLILAPALIYLIYYVVMNQRGLEIDVSLMESAMPPMVMGSVMAVSYDLNPKLANLMVGIGIPVSFISLLMWYFLVS